MPDRSGLDDLRPDDDRADNGGSRDRGSEGYPPDSQEYPEREESARAGRQLPGPPLFASAEELAKAVDESWRGIGLAHLSPLRARGDRLSDATGAALPAADPDDAAAALRAARRHLRTQQVGMKLTLEEYELLHEVAKRHAVALGTLARILTVKGARALLEEE
jgi:hypothetical protein